jgi:hypothetical protein
MNDIKLDFGNNSGGDKPFKKGMIICQICGEKSRYHCREREDGTLAICKNVASDKHTKDGKGYIHILDNSNGQAKNVSKVAQKAIPDTPKADADRLNEVYTTFLDSLTLSKQHADNLLNERGLFDTKIAQNLYASVPAYEDRFEVAGKLAESYDLEGIPGFYFENGKWALHLTYPGFYVPYRDEQGRIVGLQIRQDKDGEQKYLWLSSSNKERGTSSGTPLHYVNPEKVRENNEIFVTEGALKADIIGQLYNVGVMAMGGVTVLKADSFVASLDNTFPSVERVVVAFDMDWGIKDEVRDALSKLLEALRQKYLSVFVLTWDRNLGKGMDDILFKFHSEEISAENLFTYVKAEEFQAKFLNEKTENVEVTASEQTKGSIEIDEQEIENDIDDFAPENMGLREEPTTQETMNTFGISCRDFLEMDIPNPERVMFGLGRGNVGLMIASTNIGKTTLALNLSLAAGGNKDFSPLFNENYEARRVMYVDGEATKAELQSDIRRMLESCSPEEQELIKDNLCFICDEEISDEPLDLVNPDHLNVVLNKAKEFNPDLIIVDTLSALTIMEDENDNAKVKKEVMQPLKNLGRKANAVVLLLHHTGKFIEGSFQAEDAYKGRGASAFGALSRVVFNLKQPKELKGNVALSCSKVKGQKFSPVEMELNENTRWFRVIASLSDKKKTKVDVKYDAVVNFVREAVITTGKGVKRGEIVKGLTGQVGVATVGRKLDSAVAAGDLIKSEEYGHYSVPLNPERENALAE